MSYLRPYQIECRDAVIRELSNGAKSTLIVMPTGTGKTETALDIIDTWPDQECDILCLSHRQELVQQPWERWHKKTGHYAEREQAEFKRSLLRGRSRVTFASKDSLHPERLREAFPDPNAVGLIWVDEAHHLARQNKSYQHILEYFSGNPNMRMFGVTATPDRTDEQALGQSFDSVAFDFPLLDPAGGVSAIGDGWLVQIEQQYVVIEELEYETVKTRGGDFVESDLEKLMMMDKPLYKRTSAILQLAAQMPTLCFAAGIKQAITEAKIFNAHEDNSAYAIASRVDDEDRHDFVINSQDIEGRKQMLKRWGNGQFQYVCNVGVFTEGMDAPHVMVISMGRPTKSRSLYAQMLGRGTRILKNVVEGDGWRLDTKEQRLAAIAASQKPFMTALDFVGNSRHSLISAADILGGSYSDEVVEAAKKKLASGTRNVREALAAAEADIKNEMEKRRRIQAKAQVSTRKIDPFGVVGIVPPREPGWHKGRKPTGPMNECLARFKVDQKDIDSFTFCEAKAMIGQLIKRAQAGLATYKQSKILEKHGFSGNMTFDEAKATIDRIAASGWSLRNTG